MNKVPTDQVIPISEGVPNVFLSAAQSVKPSTTHVTIEKSAFSRETLCGASDL